MVFQFLHMDALQKALYLCQSQLKNRGFVRVFYLFAVPVFDVKRHRAGSFPGLRYGALRECGWLLQRTDCLLL
jgi:hypothetical protein